MTATTANNTTPRARSSASKSPAPSEDGFSDHVSDSTINSQADSDTQWNFERVLSEAPNEDGVPWFLIQWTGYDKDEWSWEPRENITDIGLVEWAETKAKQDRGEVEPFDIEKWLTEAEVIREAKASAKWERHRKRNFKRKKHGMPLSLYDEEREQDYDLSDDGVDGDDDFNAIIPPPKPPGGNKPRPRSDADPTPHGVHRDLEPKRKATAEKRTGQSGSASTKKTTTPRKEPPKRTTTGYQGTARKPSSTTRPTPSHDRAGNAARSTNTADSGHPNVTPVAKKAKRSAGEKITHRSATGNVFISGKKTQTRPKLADSMRNPSKEARLFSNHRITRKAELRGRERADKAPSDIRQLGLFNISTGVGQNDSSNGTGSKPSSAGPSPVKEKIPSFEAIKPSLKKKPHSEAFHDTSNAEQEPPRKKPRSVRFTGDTTVAENSEPGPATYPKEMPLVDEPEAMNSDEEELFVGESSAHSLPLRPPAPDSSIARLKRMSLQDAIGKSRTQTIKKRVKLGPTDSAEADVVFEDIPKTGEPWISEFMSADPLDFDRIFTAKAFESQCQTQPGLSAGALARGIVRPDNQAANLASAAENLLLGSFGLLCFHTDFCIVIYPSGCEHWARCVPENEPNTPTGVVLKYFVFKPSLSAALPLTATDGVSHETVLSNRVNIMRTMFGFQYNELLPTQLLKHHGQHNFYLAFPPNKELMLNRVAAWLAEARPDCHLFSSQRPGDWLAFVGLGSKQCGTIIIHEGVTSCVRLFSGIAHLLHQRNNVSFAIWSLGEATHVHPPYPSMDERPSELGQIGFTRLFPHGSAVLVTPSFLLTQPIHARRLLSWYSKRLAMPGSYNKLVVTASIVEFLQDLAHEKIVQRDAFLARNSRLSRSELDTQAKQQGISQEDCAARLETLSMVTNLINSGKGNLADEAQEPFVYVDDCIDANDEQSLGNWFGFWSLNKLDCYRKFHILGSHENDYSRSLRDVRIPRYASRTTGDPEVALAKAGEAEASASDPPRAPKKPGFPSQILSRADGEEFAQYLTSDKFKYVGGYTRLYGYCVSWFNDSFQMADHFGDPTCRFETYRNWFSYTYPFGQPRGFNTYAAMFYTIDGEWDPAAYPRGRFPKRHPWIAIWRARNPHQLPYKSTELLLWDITAAERFSGTSQPHRESILPAQRALIEFVEQNSAEKNPGMPLHQVWLGGFDTPIFKSTTILDQTLEMLDIMLSDVKRWMPAPDITLPARGYRKVDLRHEQPASNVTEDRIDEADKRPEKIVFHPPRGNSQYTGMGRSKCGNVLFQEASKLRSADKTRKYLSYRFPPTMEWYMRQKAEGRHYEYINVDSWEGMFSSLSILPEGAKHHRKENHGVESASTSAQTTPRS